QLALDLDHGYVAVSRHPKAHEVDAPGAGRRSAWDAGSAPHGPTGDLNSKKETFEGARKKRRVPLAPRPDLPALQLRPDRLEHRLGHEARYVAPQPRHLPHERRGEKGPAHVGDEKDGLDLGPELLIHLSHLELVLEVG